MAQAARRYDYYGTAAPKREQRRSRRPDVRVVPGGNADHQTLSPMLVNGFKIAIALAAVLLVVCGVRVWLSAKTVSTLQNVEALEAQIDLAYSDGSELEIEHSILSNTTRIQREAEALGMSAPEKRTYIKVALAPKVAYDRDGSISIAGTLTNIEEYAALKKK